MSDFFEESAKIKPDMTINDWLETRRQKRLAEIRKIESPKIFDTDNPYGPSGVYDASAIPNPYIPRKIDA
jgi:hypothetical protein